MFEAEPLDLVRTGSAAALHWIEDEIVRLTENARKRALRAGQARRPRGRYRLVNDPQLLEMHGKGWTPDMIAVTIGITSMGVIYHLKRLGLTPNRKRDLTRRAG